MFGSPGSMVTGSFSMFMFIWALQKAIKLGKEVGLAYQSPPPPYFISPIFNVDCASEAPQKQQNSVKIMSEINLFMGFIFKRAKVRKILHLQFAVSSGKLCKKYFQEHIYTTKIIIPLHAIKRL